MISNRFYSVIFIIWSMILYFLILFVFSMTAYADDTISLEDVLDYEILVKSYTIDGKDYAPDKVPSDFIKNYQMTDFSVNLQIKFQDKQPALGNVKDIRSSIGFGDVEYSPYGEQGFNIVKKSGVTIKKSDDSSVNAGDTVEVVWSNPFKYFSAFIEPVSLKASDLDLSFKINSSALYKDGDVVSNFTNTLEVPLDPSFIFPFFKDKNVAMVPNYKIEVNSDRDRSDDIYYNCVNVNEGILKSIARGYVFGYFSADPLPSSDYSLSYYTPTLYGGAFYESYVVEITNMTNGLDSFYENFKAESGYIAKLVDVIPLEGYKYPTYQLLFESSSSISNFKDLNDVLSSSSSFDFLFKESLSKQHNEYEISYDVKDFSYVVYNKGLIKSISDYNEKLKDDSVVSSKKLSNLKPYSINKIPLKPSEPRDVFMTYNIRPGIMVLESTTSSSTDYDDFGRISGGLNLDYKSFYGSDGVKLTTENPVTTLYCDADINNLSNVVDPIKKTSISPFKDIGMLYYLTDAVYNYKDSRGYNQTLRIDVTDSGSDLFITSDDTYIEGDNFIHWNNGGRIVSDLTLSNSDIIDYDNVEYGVLKNNELFNSNANYSLSYGDSLNLYDWYKVDDITNINVPSNTSAFRYHFKTKSDIDLLEKPKSIFPNSGFLSFSSYSVKFSNGPRDLMNLGSFDIFGNNLWTSNMFSFDIYSSGKKVISNNKGMDFSDKLSFSKYTPDTISDYENLEKGLSKLDVKRGTSYTSEKVSMSQYDMYHSLLALKNDSEEKHFKLVDRTWDDFDDKDESYNSYEFNASRLLMSGYIPPVKFKTYNGNDYDSYMRYVRFTAPEVIDYTLIDEVTLLYPFRDDDKFFNTPIPFDFFNDYGIYNKYEDPYFNFANYKLLSKDGDVLYSLDGNLLSGDYKDLYYLQKVKLSDFPIRHQFIGDFNLSNPQVKPGEVFHSNSVPNSARSLYMGYNSYGGRPPADQNPFSLKVSTVGYSYTIPNFVSISKSAKTPVVDTLDDPIVYDISMYNGLSDSHIISIFDVLPYMNDGRGSVVNGSFFIDDIAVSDNSLIKDFKVYYSDKFIRSDVSANNVDDQFLKENGFKEYNGGKVKATSIYIKPFTMNANDHFTISLTLSTDSLNAGDQFVNTANYSIDGQPGVQSGAAVVSSGIPDRMISGMIFEDVDETGYFQPGVTPVFEDKVDVALFDNNNKVVKKLSTSDGNYMFNGLEPGDYKVGFKTSGLDDGSYIVSKFGEEIDSNANVNFTNKVPNQDTEIVDGYYLTDNINIPDQKLVNITGINLGLVYQEPVETNKIININMLTRLNTKTNDFRPFFNEVTLVSDTGFKQTVASPAEKDASNYRLVKQLLPKDASRIDLTTNLPLGYQFDGFKIASSLDDLSNATSVKEGVIHLSDDDIQDYYVEVVLTASEKIPYVSSVYLPLTK